MVIWFILGNTIYVLFLKIWRQNVYFGLGDWGNYFMALHVTILPSKNTVLFVLFYFVFRSHFFHLIILLAYCILLNLRVVVFLLFLIIALNAILSQLFMVFFNVYYFSLFFVTFLFPLLFLLSYPLPISSYITYHYFILFPFLSFSFQCCLFNIFLSYLLISLTK